MKYKVGTITFHWATNYGAVLQAFALQKYLLSENIETEIIDYVPGRIIVLERLSWLKNLNFGQIRRAKKLSEFRRKELILSNKKFWTNRGLKKCESDYSCVVTGSDQVWNRAFTMTAEGKPTRSYFLDFVGENSRRVSYATSFGFNVADEEYIEIVRNEISRFSYISVRERTGLSILNQFDVKGTMVCDPTLLLERTVYDNLANMSDCSENSVFSFILHKNQYLGNEIVRIINQFLNIKDNYSSSDEILSVYDWLKSIRDAKMVITNSFHAVMFSLIFNTPFIVVPVEGAQMNDRIVTILESVGLLDRFIQASDKEQVIKLYDKEIDWCTVNKKLENLRKQGQNFLNEAVIE